jgi:hypothetical protein
MTRARAIGGFTFAFLVGIAIGVAATRSSLGVLAAESEPARPSPATSKPAESELSVQWKGDVVTVRNPTSQRYLVMAKPKSREAEGAGGAGYPAETTFKVGKDRELVFIPLGDGVKACGLGGCAPCYPWACPVPPPPRPRPFPSPEPDLQFATILSEGSRR